MLKSADSNFPDLPNEALAPLPDGRRLKDYGKWIVLEASVLSVDASGELLELLRDGTTGADEKAVFEANEKLIARMALAKGLKDEEDFTVRLGVEDYSD